MRFMNMSNQVLIILLSKGIQSDQRICKKKYIVCFKCICKFQKCTLKKNYYFITFTERGNMILYFYKFVQLPQFKLHLHSILNVLSSVSKEKRTNEELTSVHFVCTSPVCFGCTGKSTVRVPCMENSASMVLLIKFEREFHIHISNESKHVP